MSTSFSGVEGVTTKSAMPRLRARALSASWFEPERTTTVRDLRVGCWRIQRRTSNPLFRGSFKSRRSRQETRSASKKHRAANPSQRKTPPGNTTRKTVLNRLGPRSRVDRSASRVDPPRLPEMQDGLADGLDRGRPPRQSERLEGSRASQDSQLSRSPSNVSNGSTAVISTA